jgi:hypothetical protein
MPSVNVIMTTDLGQPNAAKAAETKTAGKRDYSAGIEA